jgi:hypothetical protein
MTVPALGTSRPASRPSKVVFPLPDGPMIATNSPSRMVKFTSRSTVNVCAPLS